MAAPAAAEDSGRCLSGKGPDPGSYPMAGPEPFHPPREGRKERHMNDSTIAVPDTIRKEARDRALKVIEANPGCASYVRPEDLETAALFIPVVSIIKPTKDDFYDPIPQIGIMAKPQLVNLLKEKAGVNIVRTDTEKRGEYIWVAHCFGEKRQPDGTMLQGDASYEFDAAKRAELDAINQPQKYGTDIGKRKHLLETAKFGEQRAVTGAQFALIHKLAHVARSFKSPEELMRGMIVCRIDRNVNGVLADPSLRKEALGQLLGAKENVFGPANGGAPLGIEMKTEPAASPAAAEQAEPADDWEEEPAKPPEPDPLDVAKDQLRGYLKRMMPAKGISEINTMLDNKDATLQDVNLLIDRCEAYLQKRAEKQRRTA
jgi:hypothetical protein